MSKRQTMILVVDDDLRIHRAVSELFERYGYQIRVARGPSEAIAVAEEVDPAAVITELSLEGMDGLTLIQKLRQRNRCIAAVVLTAEPSASSAARALRLGCDDYLIKHSDSLGQLRDSIRKAMRVRQREVEVERLLAELTELNDAFLENMKALSHANAELERSMDSAEEAPKDPDDWSVLVIDDDVSIVAVLEALLRSQNLQVEGANSGAEAREWLAKRRFDVVITDKNLGDANGVELIAEIKEQSPDTKVLLMTGFATVDSAVEAMRHGAVGYLRKPFEDLSVVINRVEELIQASKQEQSQADYLRAFREQNRDYLARYRLIRLKLGALKRDLP